MSWKTAKIGNLIAKVKRAGKLQATEYQDTGTFPVIDQGQSDIAGYSDNAEIVHTEPLPIVIFGDHTRRVKLAREPFICGADGTQLLYPKNNDLDPVFFYYAVKNVDLSNYAYARHFKFLKDQEIRYPDLPTQQRIASILSAYDDLIENNRRRIALLEQSAQMLYREWFVKLRFPGYETTKFFNGLPVGWTQTTVFDAVEILSGGTPKTDNTEYWGRHIPFFTPKDTGEFLYVNDTEKMITEAGLKNCNSRLYEKNILFITARGTVGKLRLAQRPMAMNQSCYALRSKCKLTQHHLYFTISDRVNHFKSQAGGAVFAAIVVDTFKNIPLLIPSDEIAEEFARFAQNALSQIDVLAQQNGKLTRARDLLLPRLMDGRIPV